MLMTSTAFEQKSIFVLYFAFAGCRLTFANELFVAIDSDQVGSHHCLTTRLPDQPETEEKR